MDLVSLPGIQFDAMPDVFKRSRPELASCGVEFKGLKVSEIKADRSKRRVELWIAGYGNVDLGGDLILPGAAAKTIEDDFSRGLTKFFWNHQRPLGPVEVLEEHKEGLFMVGRVTNDPAFDPFLAQIEDKTAAHGSIGWSPREAERISAEEVERRFGIDSPFPQVRVIKTMRVWEGSAVIWPMNELVKVVQVRKSKGSAMKFKLENKGLYELSDVIYCLARIRSLTTAEWAALTDDEAEAAQQLVAEMAATEKSIAAGVASRETKAGKPPAAPAQLAEGDEPEAIKGLIVAAESRTKAIRAHANQ